MLAIDEALHEGGIGIKLPDQFYLVLELLEILFAWILQIAVSLPRVFHSLLYHLQTMNIETRMMLINLRLPRSVNSNSNLVMAI